MLDLPRDTACDIEFGAHGNTSLANLACMLGEPCVDGGTCCADFGTKHVGQVEEHVEPFLAADTVTAGNDDGGVLDIDFRLFDVAVDDFNNEITVGHIFFRVKVDYFALVFGVEDFFFHHSFAHGGHLRTAVGVDNRGYDVPAECRTNLVKEVLIFFACFGVFVVADNERCAVGGKTRMEA